MELWHLVWMHIFFKINFRHLNSPLDQKISNITRNKSIVSSQVCQLLYAHECVWPHARYTGGSYRSKSVWCEAHRVFTLMKESRSALGTSYQQSGARLALSTYFLNIYLLFQFISAAVAQLANKFLIDIWWRKMLLCHRML